jgi:NhaP-type Na+/H+ and K+/H+ antiporter
MSIFQPRLALFIALALLAEPQACWAYVDPGIIASLYQIVFVVIFGTVFAWVSRPMRFISYHWHRLRGTLPPEQPSEKSGEADSEGKEAPPEPKA